MKQQMPVIDLNKIEGLTDEGREIVRGIVATQGKNAGRLRASKPKVGRHEVGVDRYGRVTYEPDAFQGKAAYVWRMVAFLVSPKHQHQCMPMTADFDLPGNYMERLELAKKLDAQIVDRVVDSIKMDEWHGVKRWGNAYGVIGQPVVRKGGSIVYR